MTTDVVRGHPAKFSEPITAPIVDEVERWRDERGRTEPFRIVDPFAGVGTIHAIADACGWESVGIELESEWSGQHPSNVTGDSNDLSTWAPLGLFDAVITSPCYGNRMADRYRGQRDTCLACIDGVQTRWDGAKIVEEPCSVCGGTGNSPSRRHNYAAMLGRDPSFNSSAVLQWGTAYREFHTESIRLWRHALRSPGLVIVNISDHLRAGIDQGVHLWWAAALGDRFAWRRAVPVYTRRQGLGANRSVRVSCEWLLVYEALV